MMMMMMMMMMMIMMMMMMEMMLKKMKRKMEGEGGEWGGWGEVGGLGCATLCGSSVWSGDGLSASDLVKEERRGVPGIRSSQLSSEACKVIAVVKSHLKERSTPEWAV